MPSPTPDPPPALPDPAAHDPYIALRFPNYRRYFIGNACSLFGTQMAAVTIGWEIYARTRSAVALGLVGLVQVMPIILLALPAGHLVDRVNRKKLILLATSVLVISYLLMGFSSRFSEHMAPAGWEGNRANPLTWVSRGMMALSDLFHERNADFSDLHIPILLLLLLVNGVCRAVNQPAKQSLLPALVPAQHFSNAVTWNASLFEISNVGGPMVAGFTIAAFMGPNPHDSWAFAIIYWFNAFCQFVQLVNVARIKLTHTPRPPEPVTMRSMLAGVHFVYVNKVILGTITLDLFAVLLGGSTALLPLFATDILHVGPIGLGWLRAALSIGALTTAMMIAHQPPMQKAGRNLMLAVTGFGLATIVFGLSQNFWLSLVALLVTGACDNVSVVVRHSLVQLLTPDEMRGRVNAVNSVFISTSNEMGEFESGITAALGIRLLGIPWGPMIAVAAGGLGTIFVVAWVALAWPQVAAVTRLAHPKEE